MKTDLQKIADYLLLKSPFIQDIGLFHGKMGIVLSLFLYADKYQDDLLKEYAWELYQQVHETIHANMPIGLEYGLAGIGYATTLMCKTGLADCNLNEVLAEVDSRIMEHDPRRIEDMSVRTGAAGLMSYIKLRETTGLPLTSFDTCFLTELKHTMFVQGSEPLSPDIMDILNTPSFPIEDYIEKPCGIDEGSSYYILKSVLL